MITLEEAFKIAKSCNKKVDACLDYGKGWRFFERDSDAVGDAGVVVMKSDGRTKHFINFILDDNPTNKPKEVDIKEFLHLL